ncbi:ABC transporter substrate-binding protein [Anaerocolumna cellulosilytica]|uniref:ABC transporter substrate-binding protein n=1 Tax=Anaerocolumna cellulosilytica TaxID=433286 RepID=A0A6S6R447_9FIRM|nr:ABC transporter substrate-binding protein [Anaerocolumna cellulosilytica]MBB5195595.1 peptide/nickel transport system substrate-binding protein [Anaerocolumna cellulosilytica]BCJ93838.1 ABC transporter substrate-binding protein [Anaerocolumna cellulosilytica]
MQKKRIMRMLLAILTTILLVGCKSNKTKIEEPLTQPSVNSSSKLKDALTVSVGGGFYEGNFNPCTGYGTYGYGLFHTSLLKITTNVKTECDLATEYQVSEDGLIYTFTLREDVKFSDGQKLKPEDVVFTFKTAKNSGSSVDLTMLENVEVIDSNKIQFTLNRAYSPFTRTVALLGIVPEHAYNDSYASNPIGTGPFKVKQLDVGQQLIVEPNEYYYGTKSQFKQITFLNIDEETALAAAKSGQLDLVMVNPEYAKETVEGMHIETIKTADNRGFNLPCIPETTNAAGETVGNNITSDPVVRKALNIGISRQEIIDNALNGVGTASWVRFEGLPWANEEPLLTDGRVVEAKALLEEAGWVDTDGDGIREKNGIKCEFRISGRTDDLQRYNLAVAFSENAKILGINIIAEALDWTTCKQIARNVPTCIGTGDYSFIDVYNAFHSSFSGVDMVNLSNSAMYSNPTVDGYLEAMIAATSEDEAIEFGKKAQYDGTTGANADFPYIWLVNIDHTYFVRDGLNLGTQRIHPHGHGAPVIQNLSEWTYTN